MKMKIGVVNTASKRLIEQIGLLSLQRENLTRSLGHDVEVVIEFSGSDIPEAAYDVMFNPFLSSLDGKVILEKLFQLQEDGCDGVIIACTCDPLLAEARALLRIPIVGVIEASVLSACMAAPKFGILVHPDRRVAEKAEELVARYGLQSRMTPMVYASGRLAELMDQALKTPEIVREELLSGCREVVEKGAHSVILGGGALGSLATACGISEVPDYGAPVFDPICVAAHMIRYRVDLQRSLGIPPISRVGAYRQLPAALMKRVMQSFQFTH